MSKYLFLDIDGVLNHEDFYTNGDYLNWCNEIPYPLSEFDPVVVNRINEVLDKTSAKLVISSTWRIGDANGELANILNKVGLKREFETTPVICLYVNKIDGRTPCRGDEIKTFLDKKDDVETYVIIDDDNDMLPEQMEHFVHCDYFHGFTEADKEKTIEILNK